MIMKTTVEEYLTKAAEAQAIADKMAGGYLKQSCLDIAEGYRDLAKSQQSSDVVSFEKPSLTSPQR